MKQVLHRLHWKTLLLYLDDVIVNSPDFDSHHQGLEEVLRQLQDAGLKLKPPNVNFCNTKFTTSVMR